MFKVPKQIALNITIKSNTVLQMTFINFDKRQFLTRPTKFQKRENVKKCNMLVSKTYKNDRSKLNYGLPSSFTTLCTRMTTERG